MVHFLKEEVLTPKELYDFIYLFNRFIRFEPDNSFLLNCYYKDIDASYQSFPTIFQCCWKKPSGWIWNASLYFRKDKPCGPAKLLFAYQSWLHT